MKVINFGSLNLDYVYTVDHCVNPGETIHSYKRERFCGGKGLNQSIALAKAGIPVYHVGKIGADGEVLVELLEETGVNCTYMMYSKNTTGQAIIQIDENAQNAILLYGGANQEITKEEINQVLEHFEEGDLILLQNEISYVEYIIDQAYRKGLLIAFNPSPFDETIKTIDLSKVTYLLVNEIEGGSLSGLEEAPHILNKLTEQFPETHIVMTLGEKGAWYGKSDKRIYKPAYMTKAVDTTGAGDTFTGYFIAGMLAANSPEVALMWGQKAASIAVSRKGAAPSIPWKDEISLNI